MQISDARISRAYDTTQMRLPCGRNLFLLRWIDENGFSASVIPSDISPRVSAVGGDMAIRREGEVVEVAVLLQVFLRNQVFITVRERNV